MRFSLQDVKKTIQRRGSTLRVSFHFLRPGDLHDTIERLITYHEHLLGQRQGHFSLDEARACIGDYRLAHCLLATLSHWYTWQPREWASVLHTLGNSPALAHISSPIQLRLALYDYVNEHAQGFLDGQTRLKILESFASLYEIAVADLEYLLVLDSAEEALLVRDAAQLPSVQQVATRYNQWVFEAALCNASNVQFVVDCAAFGKLEHTAASTGPTVGTGVGATIKRLCFLARKLGVYYDLSYEHTCNEQTCASQPAMLLTLTLYGPQEVTGAPQQYGLRLARLCRMLLGYGNREAEHGQAKKKASLASAIVEAQATVHFLQRTYSFVMHTNLLQLLPSVEVTTTDHERSSSDTTTLFDSGIEQAFSEAFIALASNQGVDGWQLEREPEPLLLDYSIFIPDFALTRPQQRVYVEILGFWTPAYRERKIQKLLQLQGRDDLLLVIPLEARDAFVDIAPYFPIVFYDGQVSVSEVLHVMHSRYDDFARRLGQIDVASVRARVKSEGLWPEQACYQALHCYRRSEIQRAAEHIVTDDIMCMPGIGLYSLEWMEQLKHSFLAWIYPLHTASLTDATHEIKRQVLAHQQCDNAVIELLIGLWPEVYIRRTSIFDAIVELVDAPQCETQEAEEAINNGETYPVQNHPTARERKQVRERHTSMKKRAVRENITTQGDLWR